MTRHVLDVGNCNPDHRAIAAMLTRHFAVEVRRAHTAEETVDLLRTRPFDLVLINRQLDHDYSDGLTLIEHIKGDPHLATTPVMLVTNFADHQQRAIAAGAAPGFGKRELHLTRTIDRLRPYLDPNAA